jgi:hypothetical protein
MSIRLPFVSGCLVLISLVAGMAGASAAETGTKTMPSSSVYPPPTPLPCSAPVNITTATCQVNPARTGTAFRTNCFGRCRKNNWPRRPREVSFARPDCCVAGLRVFQASATERGFKTLFLKFGVAGSPHRGCSLLRSDVLQRG